MVIIFVTRERAQCANNRQRKKETFLMQSLKKERKSKADITTNLNCF